MEDPEGDLQDPKVELLKTKRSTSVTSETTLAEGSHLDLHQVQLKILSSIRILVICLVQVARDGNIEQLMFDNLNFRAIANIHIKVLVSTTHISFYGKPSLV